MIMCVLLCYPVSFHMLQLLLTGRPISSRFKFLPYIMLTNSTYSAFQNVNMVGHQAVVAGIGCAKCQSIWSS